MIKINDKFCIDADENQFMLKELTTIQDKESKNFGEERIVTLGYYTTLEGAIKGLEKILIRRAIRIKDFTIKTIVDEIRAVHEDIFKVLEAK